MAAQSRTRHTRSNTIASRSALIAKDFHAVGDAAKQMAADSVGAVQETAAEYLDQGRSQVHRLGDGVRTKVSEQPAKALLLAAGIGFLVGALFIRR